MKKISYIKRSAAAWNVAPGPAGTRHRVRPVPRSSPCAARLGVSKLVPLDQALSAALDLSV